MSLQIVVRFFNIYLYYYYYDLMGTFTFLHNKNSLNVESLLKLVAAKQLLSFPMNSFSYRSARSGTLPPLDKTGYTDSVTGANPSRSSAVRIVYMIK